MDYLHPNGPSLLNFILGLNEYPSFHFYRLMKKYGDIVKCTPGLYLINHPDLARDILNNDHKLFSQEDFISKRTKRVFRKGLMINSGASWASQRKLMQPVFQSKWLENQSETMNEEIDRTVSDLNAIPIGQSINIVDHLEDMAIRISGRLLFDTDLSERCDEIKKIFSEGLNFISKDVPFSTPGWLPTPANLKLKQNTVKADEILTEIVTKRNGAIPHNLLSILRQRFLKNDTSAADKQHMLDEMKSMLAGYFPITCNLSIFFHLLGRFPKYLHQIREEILAVKPNVPSAQIHHYYPLTSQVLMETMRYYPAAYSIWRNTKKDYRYTNIRIPKGKDVVISIFNVHRNPSCWSNPDEFRPERFSKEENKKRPNHYFIPFGWGSRNCIGDKYAMMIIFKTIVKIIGNYQFKIPPQEELQLRKAPLMCPKTVLVERIN